MFILDFRSILPATGLSPPKNLKVERQLMNSVVISWLPPDDVEPEQIKGFSIRADGELKDMLIGPSRTKAIVSDVKRDKVEGFILIENVHSKVFLHMRSC